MNKYFFWQLLLLVLLSQSSSAQNFPAEWSDYHRVYLIETRQINQDNPDSEYLDVVNVGYKPWSRANSPCRAITVRIPFNDSAVSYEEIFSTVLMASATGKRARFLGRCNDAGSIFEAYSVQVIFE